MSERPGWWRDVHRALESAFSDYAEVLDTLETVLSKETSGRTDGLAALARELDSVQGRLRRALKLARSRTDDALASGRKPPSPAVYQERITAHERRSAAVGKLLRNRMIAVAEELSRPHGRRWSRRIFRDIPPSHIDLRL